MQTRVVQSCPAYKTASVGRGRGNSAGVLAVLAYNLTRCRQQALLRVQQRWVAPLGVHPRRCPCAACGSTKLKSTLANSSSIPNTTTHQRQLCSSSARLSRERRVRTLALQGTGRGELQPFVLSRRVKGLSRSDKQVVQDLRCVCTVHRVPAESLVDNPSLGRRYKHEMMRYTIYSQGMVRYTSWRIDRGADLDGEDGLAIV